MQGKTSYLYQPTPLTKFRDDPVNLQPPLHNPTVRKSSYTKIYWVVNSNLIGCSVEPPRKMHFFINKTMYIKSQRFGRLKYQKIVSELKISFSLFTLPRLCFARRIIQDSIYSRLEKQTIMKLKIV